MNGEKPHVFREATKEVAFRNTCGFWADYLWADYRQLQQTTGGYLGKRTAFRYVRWLVLPPGAVWLIYLFCMVGQHFRD